MTENVRYWQGGVDKADRAQASASDAREATGGAGDGVAPVCIGVVDGPLRAEIARTYLEQSGIAAYLQADSMGSVYGLVSGPLGAVRVFVPASQAEEAARIFDEIDFG